MTLWPQPLPAAPARPNIIFILTDDQGYGDVGAFFQNLRRQAGDRSQPWFLTPQLDRLAAEGAQLTQHYCPAPVCAPSRASLLLGVHQGHANVRDNQFDKALEENHTLATVLRQAGYATAAFGKWGLQGSGTPPDWPAHPLRRGFDYYYGYIRHGDGHRHYPKEDGKEVWENFTEVSAGLDKCYTTDLFAARAKQWIIDHTATSRNQPFFVYLAFDTPHAILQYPPTAFPPGGGLHGGLQWLGRPGQMINTATGTPDSYVHPDYANATYDHDNNPATPEIPWPDVQKRYATDVRRIDDCIGDLMQLLRDLNLETNTLVVFSSDNGPSKESYLPENYAPTFFDGFGPFDGIKRDCWEGGVRVPTIARWIGRIPAGQTNTVPSGFWDWLATFADAAGVAPPARTDGVSLLPSLTGQGTQRPSRVYIEYYNNSTTPSYAEFEPDRRGRRRRQMQLLRLGDFVGVRYDIQSHADPFEIYNVITDPGQTTNLAGRPEYAELQQTLHDTVLRVRRPDASAARPYDDELVPAIQAPPTVPGLEFRVYPGAFPWTPLLDTLTPDASGHTNGFNLDVRPREDDFAILFSGYLEAPADGTYTFYLSADSAALFRIHEATVIDADYGYTPGTLRSATIRLQAGKHPIRLYYLRRQGGAPRLDLQWSGPGLPKQPVSAAALWREGRLPPGPPRAVDDHFESTQAAGLMLDVLANDSDDGTPEPLRIVSFTQPGAGRVELMDTRLRYTPDLMFLGVDSFTYTVSDGQDTATAKVTIEIFYRHPSEVWLPCNELSGFSVPEAGGRPFGLLSGYADPDVPWTAGRFGRALQFDGRDTACVLPGFKGVTGTAARTVAFWARVDPDTANRPTFISWGGDNGGSADMLGRRFDILLDHSGGYRLRAEFNGGGMDFSLPDLSDLRLDRWVHCAIVVPAGARIRDVLGYLDGQPALGQYVGGSGNDTVPVNTDAVHDVLLGQWQSDHGRAFKGALDEVHIFARALSPEEIAALANPPHPVAAAWHRRHFGTRPEDWLADDDADGLPRLAEYAFGTQPHIADPLRWPAVRLQSDRLQIIFPKRLDGLHDLDYQLSASTNLTQWHDSALHPLPTQPVPGRPWLQLLTYETDDAVTAYAARFIRLDLRLP